MYSLKYYSVTEENKQLFHNLMKSYSKELDEHQNRTTDEKMLAGWTDRIIAKQYDDGRCLKLCCKDDKAIGFLYGKIDRPEDKGFKKVGYGYVMEFFVLPEYRRKGYGKEMYSFLEKYFTDNNVHNIYLTADPVTGKPFWKALGFNENGEISPENNLPVYEKHLTKSE